MPVYACGRSEFVKDIIARISTIETAPFPSTRVPCFLLGFELDPPLFDTRANQASAEVAHCSARRADDLCPPDVEIGSGNHDTCHQHHPAAILGDLSKHRAMWRRTGGITAPPCAMRHD